MLATSAVAECDSLISLIDDSCSRMLFPALQVIGRFWREPRPGLGPYYLM